MRTGRPKQALRLSEEEQRRLGSLAQRARSLPAVARRARFLKERLEGLYDGQRPGAPRKISDEQIEQVVIQTLESTPRGQTHWSTREMTKNTGLSRMAISRIWRACGLQPHRTESFKLSPDPLLIESPRHCGPLYEPARTCAGDLPGRK